MTNTAEIKARTNWSRKIYEELLARLRRGEIGAHERLVDAVLAGQLGVSRMPVRQALVSLAQEGYLIGTSRGFMLPEMTAADAEELFEIRKMTEPAAAAAATLRLPEDALDQLQAMHAQAIATAGSGKVAQFVEANRRFRQIWLDHVPNRRLADVIHRFVAQTDMIRGRTFHDPQAQAIALAVLTRTFEAFRARDPLAARQAIEAMIDRGREQFLAMLACETASPEARRA